MRLFFKGIIHLLSILSLITLVGCALPFKPAELDPKTGMFMTTVEVDDKYIKIYKPLAGVSEEKFIYLRAYSPYGGDKFYSFMKDSLEKIGFKKVYSEKELAQMIIQGGLSGYVTNISDLISLNNLAKATGPYLVLESHVYPVADTVFRFDLQLIEPLSGDTYLEISRIRTNWLDMDTEINYPIINVIKKWYQESTKLPYKKEKEEPEEKKII